MSNQTPPGYAAAPANGAFGTFVEQQAEHVGQRRPVGSIDGPCSVTSGSLRAGAIAEPIFDGPPGAPMPVRKRRMFATSVVGLLARRARRRGVAHGCGSP